MKPETTLKEMQEMPVECPFERDGVVEGLRKLTKEEGLMEQLVCEVKRSNSLALRNNKWQKTLAYLFALAVLILLAVGILAWEIFGNVTVVEGNMGRSIREQRELTKDVKALVAQQKKTDEKLDDAKEALDEKPTIELVPEKDPEKAKDAPLKVRIVPPKASKKDKPDDPHPPAPTQTAVEVPLPVKDVKAVPTEKK
jgi:hypothetical protein